MTKRESTTVAVGGETVRVAKYHSKQLARAAVAREPKTCLVLGDVDDACGPFWVASYRAGRVLERAGYEIG